MKKKSNKSHSWQDNLIDATIAIVLGVFAIICIYPFYYMFINTISDNTLVNTGRIKLLPQGIHFTNYVNILKLDGLFQAAMISLARTVLGSVFTLTCAAVPAYCFSKEEYWGKKVLYKYAIIVMYFNAGVIPTFLTYRMIGIYNTFWVYILPCVVTPFNMILVKTYMESLPPALEEVAEIDGAGYLTRLTKVVLPLCKPILATITVFSAVGQWNGWMDTLLYTKKSELRTLQYVLYWYMNDTATLANLVKENATGNIDLSTMITPNVTKYTISAVVVTPIMIVYPLFQRYFIKGMMVGAIKG